MTAPPVADVAPLAGFTVGVTAARRAEELIALLQRKGAQVLHGPAIRIVPLADDREALTATRAVLAAPVDLVVVTTGIGFRGWMDAADGWGIGEQLRAAMGGATVYCRGPKARGAVRAAGLVDAWSPPSEESAELLEHLLTMDLHGKRVAIQLHGEPLRHFVSALRAAGAEVVEVPVYRWIGPADLAPLDRLIDALVGGQLDAVTFTSAPAVASLLARAADLGHREAVLAALRSDVLACCVGPVCALPLVELDVPCSLPDRGRIGSMVRQLVHDLPARTARFRVAGRAVELRGHSVLVDGVSRPIPPTPLAVFRVLAAKPGRVVSRAELLGALPSGGDEHAVETAIGRLRSALGESRLVQTVVKRGYRIPVEHTN